MPKVRFHHSLFTITPQTDGFLRNTVALTMNRLAVIVLGIGLLSVASCTNGDRCDNDHICDLEDVCIEGFCVSNVADCQANASPSADRTCVCDDGFFPDDGGCSQCGRNATFDAIDDGCFCNAGFVIGADPVNCIEDREAFCREAGVANARYCNPAVETCSCGPGFGQGFASDTGDLCCCNVGTEQTSDGQCA